METLWDRGPRHLLCVMACTGILCAGAARAQQPPASVPEAPPPAPVPETAPPPAAVSAAAPAAVSAPGPAVVVLVRGGWVVIESERELHVGDHFYVYRRTPGSPDDRRTGMLVIERVRGQQGAGRLIRNAYAETGDVAVPTSDRFREPLVYGERFPRTWRLYADALAGPLLNSPTTGLGLFTRAALEYRFAFPIKLAVEFGPGVLATGLSAYYYTQNPYSSGYQRLDPSFAGGVRGMIGLAVSGFELSAGIGGAVDTSRADLWALQMGLSARFGSLDGLNATLHATFFLPAGTRKTEFDAMSGTFYIPVHRRVTMTLQAGGGLPFWVYATIGFNAYLAGTGGPGTWILITGIGGFGQEQRNSSPPTPGSTPSYSGYNYAQGGGPIFELGFEHRF